MGGRKGLKSQRSVPKAQARENWNKKRIELKRDVVSKKRGAVSLLLGKNNSATTCEGLMAKMQAATTAFEETEATKARVAAAAAKSVFHVEENSRKAYMKECRKVIDQADVILQVLDARDPLGCRHFAMESAVLNAGKRLVLVLNKIDLIPNDNLQAWIPVLKKDFPVIPFKASTQSQGKRLSQARGGSSLQLGTKGLFGSHAVGAEDLMQLLKNYCRTSSIKTSITVGVIGYPNVGKSSLINSLKRNRVAGVSATAGFTKCLQEIHLDKKIKLLDCPGIVFDDSNVEALLLRNCLNAETMKDPIPAVQVIVSRCSKQQLEALYSTSVSDIIAFLVHVAKSRGKLGRGGIPDTKSAARIVIQDWNSGRIPFFTKPPEETSLEEEAMLLPSSKIVSAFSATEFDINDLQREVSLEKVPVAPEALLPRCSAPVNTITTNSRTVDKNVLLPPPKDGFTDDDDSDDDDMSDASSTTSSLAATTTTTTPALPDTIEDKLNPKTALVARRQAKNARKAKRRAKKRQIGNELVNIFCESMQKIGLNVEIE